MFHLPCLTTLMSLKSFFVSINEVNIAHTKGIGILGVRNENFKISKSSLNFNLVNGLIYRGLHTFVTECQFMHGQGVDIKLGTGLSVFTDGHPEDYYTVNKIHLININFKNNGGPYGNLYVQIVSYNAKADLIINNMTSLTESNLQVPGIYMQYDINYEWFSLFNIKLSESYFEGNCIHIIGYMRWSGNDELAFNFDVTNVTIAKSRCAAAITAYDSHSLGIWNLKHILDFSNILISDSHYDIFHISGRRMWFSKAKFLTNNGSFVVSNGIIDFYETTIFESNNASHDSILLILNSSKVSFHKRANFIHNKAYKGGAISLNSSRLHLYNNEIYFTNNYAAESGGAIYLKQGSLLLALGLQTRMYFWRN